MKSHNSGHEPTTNTSCYFWQNRNPN